MLQLSPPTLLRSTAVSLPLLPKPLGPRPIRRGRVMAAGTMYELLAVEETAGPEEIKAAYRRAARRWHPDACRSDGDRGAFAERFMRAREAYEVLSDPALREDYDLALRAGVAPESWAAAVGGGVALRRRRGRRSSGGGGGGFGDWEAQLEGLGEGRRRSGEGRRRGGAGSGGLAIAIDLRLSPLINRYPYDSLFILLLLLAINSDIFDVFDLFSTARMEE
uniref:J domain-containing protein n=1 Tax=Ananas comosus var. bracteatus TaxID=296719 RepID=A0A6V7PQQ9_ANACO|nr:unnamed protein product [Ananas comosus var. bracteatus]